MMPLGASPTLETPGLRLCVAHSQLLPTSAVFASMVLYHLQTAN